MMPSAMEQLRSLEEQRSTLVENARAELLEKIHSDLNALRALGFNYELTKSWKGARRKKPVRRGDAAPCKICGFKTERPHDARAHRSQTKKAPFTKRELTKRGLSRIK